MRTIPYINRNELIYEQEYQLTEMIIKNINSGLKMQTVYREMNSFLYGKRLIESLIKHLMEQGLNVLLFSDNIKENGDPLSLKEYTKLCVCTEKTIGKQIANSYDIILIDAPVSGFETQFIEDTTPYMAHQNLRSFIKSAIKNEDTYIINFEKNSSVKEWIMWIPIIATSEMLTVDNCKIIYHEYEESCKQVFFELRKCQLELENEKKIGVSKKYSEFQLDKALYQQIDNECVDEICDEELAEKIGHLEWAMSAMMDQLFKVEEMVQKLSEEVGKLRREIRRVNSAFDESRKILEIYASVNDTGNLESNLFVKRIIDSTIKERAIDLERMQEYDGYHYAEDFIKSSLGSDAWKKMSDESKKLLITAKLYLNELMSYGENIDYSSVCMLVSKVYEIELSKRILDGYVKYLKQIGMRKVNFPSALIVEKNGRTTVLKRDDFTLGNCGYIMGQIGRDSKDAEKNKRLFSQYCQEQLVIENSPAKIKKWIRKIDAEIKFVNNEYRKPAAHKGAISMVEACDCMGYFCDGDFTKGDIVLTRFLEACRF